MVQEERKRTRRRLKTMKSLAVVFSLVVFMTAAFIVKGIAACSERQEALQRQPALGIYSAALRSMPSLSTRLDEMDEMGGMYIIMGPSNEAFLDYIESRNTSAAELLADVEELEPLLLNHIIETSNLISSSDIAQGGNIQFRTLADQIVTAVASSGNRTLFFGTQNSAFALTDDIEFCNGNVYIVDNILALPTPAEIEEVESDRIGAEEEEAPGQNFPLPPPVCNAALGVLAKRSDLSIYSSAIRAAGLDGMFANRSLEVTIFAPSDDAFEHFAEEQNIPLSALLLDGSLLAPILTFPIVSEKLTMADVVLVSALSGGSPSPYPLHNIGQAESSAETTQLMFEALGDANVRLGQQSAHLLETDIEVCGAVVHVIDRVLLPPTSAEELAAYRTTLNPTTCGKLQRGERCSGDADCCSESCVGTFDVSVYFVPIWISTCQ